MKPRVLDILKRLMAFDTVSSESNMALIDYVRDLLLTKGIESLIVKDETGRKANLFASTGPRELPGILLSGHTDVVPAAGQAWTFPAFQATVLDGKIYGRGSCDMKGFIALAIDAMLEAADHSLSRPLQLALSHDEEIGCVGVRRLLDVLHLAPVRPFLCMIGEPTNMQFVLGHKGKGSYRTYCRGLEAHSSLAPRSVNAIHVACDFITALRQSQLQLQEQGAQDADYDVPYSTVHVGQIVGGKALNIVPNLCTLDFEVRNLPADDLDQFLEQMQAPVQCCGHRDRNPERLPRPRHPPERRSGALSEELRRAGYRYIQGFVWYRRRVVQAASGCASGGLRAGVD
jgi:acetylornithine deacetylase